MECLGRKSSVLEVFTGKVRGRIFISDGDIVHAESGSLQGEVALYGLLGLRGGEFNLKPFSEPANRTVSGHYEFLLMEAARLSDEGSNPLESANIQSGTLESLAPPAMEESLFAEPAPPQQKSILIQETLLASGSATVLYSWECPDTERRLNLLKQLEAEGAALSALLPAGRFERLEIRTQEDRILCQVRPELRLFVRSIANRSTGI